jgi:hypothetical protein
METENNRILLRITAASILGAVGAALMSRLPQMLPGNIPMPWYRDGYMLAGIILVIAALLVLVISPTRWKRIWNLIIGFPRWVRITFIWIRYGPKCIIEDPVMQSNKLEKPPGVSYEVQIRISIKNKGKPLKITLASMWMHIKQKTEWNILTMGLSNRGGTPETELKPWEEGNYLVVVSGAGSGNPQDFPDITKKYQWGIRAVNLSLPNGGMKEFHKGIKLTSVRHPMIGAY